MGHFHIQLHLTPSLFKMAAIAQISSVANIGARVATVSNGSKTNMMQVWKVEPKYETFSFLPQLTSAELGKQVEYMIRNKWAPCIEFAYPASATILGGAETTVGASQPCYYDNRYWTMYKLPMFGCTSAQDVIYEVENCKRDFPGTFIRVIGFDNTRQVQTVSFIIAKP